MIEYTHGYNKTEVYANVGDYASQVVSARLSAVNDRLSARMSEITARTGIRFSDLFAEQIRRSTQVVEDSDGVAGDKAGYSAKSRETANVYQTDEAEPSTPVSSYAREGYDELIGAAAAKYGVSGALLRAVIWAESNFDAMAVSSKGAMGLMQLMPQTAAGLGITDAFDPAQNIDGGAKLLAQKLEKYNGDLSMALASYNCGDAGLSNRGVFDLSDPEQYSLLPGETQGYLSRLEGYLESVGISLSGVSSYIN